MNKVQLTEKKVNKLQTEVARAAREFPSDTIPNDGSILLVWLAGIVNETKAMKATWCMISKKKVCGVTLQCGTRSHPHGLSPHAPALELFLQWFIASSTVGCCIYVCLGQTNSLPMPTRCEHRWIWWGHWRFHLSPQPTPTSLSRCALEGKWSCMNMHEHTHMCMHTLAHTWTHPYVHACTHTCMHKPMQTHTRALTFAHTHALLEPSEPLCPWARLCWVKDKHWGHPTRGPGFNTQQLMIVCRGAQGCRAMHHPAAIPHLWLFFSCQPCCLTMDHPLRKQTNKQITLESGLKKPKNSWKPFYQR